MKVDPSLILQLAEQFKEAMREIGLDVPRSGLARSRAEAVDLARTLGFPLVIRPSFTLGGVGGGIAYNIEEFRELAETKILNDLSLNRLG